MIFKSVKNPFDSELPGPEAPFLPPINGFAAQLAQNICHCLIQMDVPANNFTERFMFTLRNLGCRYTFRCLSDNFLSFSNHYYMLYLNLSSISLPKNCRLSYLLKIADESDFEILLDQIGDLEPHARKEIISRLFFLQAGFKNCYFARTSNGQLAYMQWLIRPDENKIITDHFRYRFYPLKPDQVMLENAFTFPRFRGLGLLPCISAALLTLARNQGYKNAVVYIKKNQISSLNEFVTLGFKIRRILPEFKILGHTRRML